MCNEGMEYHFKIGYNNIQGLHNKNGCKIDDVTKELSNDREVPSETWGCNCEKHFLGTRLLHSVNHRKTAGVRKGRKLGGMIVLCKRVFINYIKCLKITTFFIWIDICKNVIKNLENNLIMIFTYIHDITSTYHDPSVSRHNKLM